MHGERDDRGDQLLSHSDRCDSRSSKSVFALQYPAVSSRTYGLPGGKFENGPSVNAPHLRFHLQFEFPAVTRLSVVEMRAGRWQTRTTQYIRHSATLSNAEACA